MPRAAAKSLKRCRFGAMISLRALRLADPLPKTDELWPTERESGEGSRLPCEGTGSTHDENELPTTFRAFETRLRPRSIRESELFGLLCAMWTARSPEAEGSEMNPPCNRPRRGKSEDEDHDDHCAEE